LCERAKRVTSIVLLSVSRSALVLRLTLTAVLALAFTFVLPLGRPHVALAAECTPTVGPGIPPPASVPSGIPGFHAHWYGQSGYPTLCPGQTSRAVVAFYNSGSFGWQLGPRSLAYLGTWNPMPGQDKASLLGGNGTHGSPGTRWPEYNRPAVMPAAYVGPNQVAWFQFTVKAPSVPGTYRLYIRPLIEGEQWMEDFGVFWQVTVVPTATVPQRVTVQSFDRVADFFSDGTTKFIYDRNDSFEYGERTIEYEEFEDLLKSGVVIDVRYEASRAEQSTYKVVDYPPYGPPTLTTEIGSYDRGTTKNDIRVDMIPPASAGAQPPSYNLQRALVPAETSACTMTSGSYEYHPTIWAQGISGSFFDLNVTTGTYCYRATASGGSAFGFSAPVTMPASPAPAPGAPVPTSLDARVIRSQSGPADTFRTGDQLKIAFDGPMALCSDDTVVRLRDADGTIAEFSRAALTIDCGRNRSPEVVGGALWPEFTVITLTIAADPIIVTVGSTPGLQVPATVTSAVGIRDGGGLAWDLGRSLDIVFGDPD
jgi:hypothetical protein